VKEWFTLIHHELRQSSSFAPTINLTLITTVFHSRNGATWAEVFQLGKAASCHFSSFYWVLLTDECESHKKLPCTFEYWTWKAISYRWKNYYKGIRAARWSIGTIVCQNQTCVLWIRDKLGFHQLCFQLVGIHLYLQYCPTDWLRRASNYVSSGTWNLNSVSEISVFCHCVVYVVIQAEQSCRRRHVTVRMMSCSLRHHLLPRFTVYCLLSIRCIGHTLSSVIPFVCLSTDSLLNDYVDNSLPIFTEFCMRVQNVVGYMPIVCGTNWKQKLHKFWKWHHFCQHVGTKCIWSKN